MQVQSKSLVAAHQSLLILVSFSEKDDFADSPTVLEIEVLAAIVEQVCLVLIQCLNASYKLICEEFAVSLELKQQRVNYLSFLFVEDGLRRFLFPVFCLEPSELEWERLIGTDVSSG